MKKFFGLCCSIAIAVIAGCNAPLPTATPTPNQGIIVSSILSPANGSILTQQGSVAVAFQAGSWSGVSKFEVSIAALNNVAAPLTADVTNLITGSGGSGSPQFYGEYVWTPTAPDDYMIQIQPFDQNGVPGPIDQVTVTVAWELASEDQSESDAPLEPTPDDSLTESEAQPDEPENEEPTATFLTSAVCRGGPSSAYNVLMSFSEGMQAVITGRNDAVERWWVINIADSDRSCWAADTVLQTAGPVDTVPIQPTPLPPIGATPLNPNWGPSNLNFGREICNASIYQVWLRWTDNADDEDGFKVYRDGQLIATLQPNATSFAYDSPSYLESQYGVEAFRGSETSPRITINEDGCIF